MGLGQPQTHTDLEKQISFAVSEFSCTNFYGAGSIPDPYRFGKKKKSCLYLNLDHCGSMLSIISEHIAYSDNLLIIYVMCRNIDNK